jgi:ribonuclease P protein component
MRGPHRAAGATVVVHLGPLQGEGAAVGPAQSARAGFIVGRSVGGAVARNRVKRRLRHDIAPLLVEVPDGWGVVVRAKQAAATAPSSVVAADLREALRRCLGRVGQRPTSAAAVPQ